MRIMQTPAPRPTPAGLSADVRRRGVGEVNLYAIGGREPRQPPYAKRARAAKNLPKPPKTP
jgi:hypothetical protein